MIVVPHKAKKKIYVYLQIGVVLVFFVGIIPHTVSAEFVPYEIPENEREIIGSVQKDTIIKYNYVGQKINKTADEYGSNFERTGNKYKIYPSNQYIYINNDFHYIEYATTTLDKFNLISFDPFFKLPFVDIVKAQASTTYSASGDGSVARNTQTSWSNAQDTIDGTSVDYLDNGYTVDASWIGVNNWNINRGFLSFNTSFFDDSATVATASIFLYISSKVNEEDDGDDYIAIVQGNQSSDTVLIVGDFDECGNTVDNPTEGSNQVDITNITTATHNEWTLDANGKLWIDFTDYSKFGLREGHDIKDSAITASGNPTYRRSRIVVAGSENTGVSLDPYLEITLEATSSEEETASTTYISIEDFRYSNNINVITSKTELYTDSTTTPSEIRYTYTHIPFILWIVIGVPFLFMANILITEWKIRLRKIKE